MKTIKRVTPKLCKKLVSRHINYFNVPSAMWVERFEKSHLIHKSPITKLNIIVLFN